MNDLTYVVEPPTLAHIHAASQHLNFGMPSEPLFGALLRTLAASKPGGTFLELGTGTGLATAWLLAGMDAHSTLTSVDTEASFQAVAQQVLGSDSRLKLVLSDGIEFLASQPKHSYDVVFADAMPGKYEGLEYALDVVRPGGLYIIDDMLPQPNWPAEHPVRVKGLMETLAAHPDFEIAPMAWASGIVVAVRRA